MKSDNRMQRNQLKGQEGDYINAILSACGFNMRKLMAVFLCPKYIRSFLGLKTEHRIKEDLKTEYIFAF